MFPSELEQNAFRANNGEFGWTREQIPLVVDVLCSHGLGILGGELWWVPNGTKQWTGRVPQQSGDPAVYVWETNRQPGEAWSQFIERAAADSLAAVKRWPNPKDLPDNLSGKVFYNLTWVSETDYENLRK